MEKKTERKEWRMKEGRKGLDSICRNERRIRRKGKSTEGKE